jgi:hypothetical protein
VLGGSLFSRMRVMSGGVLLEDINLYNRQVNTFATCLPPARQFLDAAEGFGCASNQAPGLSFIEWIPEQIPAGGSRRIFFNLMSGILSQHLWIPLQYCPLVIELECAPFNEPFAPRYRNPNLPLQAGALPAAVDMSQVWDLSDVRFYADMCELDAGLQSSYAAHLSSGRTLPLAFSSFVTQTQRAEGPSQTLVLARSFTRLKGIFVTWFRENDDTGLKNISNNLYHPHGAGAYNVARDTVEVQIQIGARKFPEYPITCLAEAFYRLRLAIGAHFGDVPISVLPHEFRTNKFEKAASGPAGGVAFSGISSRGGELLTIEYKNMGATLPVDTTPTQSFVSLNFDAIVEIGDTNISVSD